MSNLRVRLVSVLPFRLLLFSIVFGWLWVLHLYELDFSLAVVVPLVIFAYTLPLVLEMMGVRLWLQLMLVFALFYGLPSVASWIYSLAWQPSDLQPDPDAFLGWNWEWLGRISLVVGFIAALSHAAVARFRHGYLFEILVVWAISVRQFSDLFAQQAADSELRQAALLSLLGLLGITLFWLILERLGPWRRVVSAS